MEFQLIMIFISADRKGSTRISSLAAILHEGGIRKANQPGGRRIKEKKELEIVP